MMEVWYQSPIGMLALVSDGTSLMELRLPKPQERKTEFQNRLDDLKPLAADNQDLHVFEETRHWLDLYFQGKNPNFTPKLNPQGTPFQQKVWRELLTIPYGQTTTYGAVAQRISCRSAQAVGQAIHRNPIAIIIPCHRVIGADGSLTGFASGLDIKEQLLKIEKAI